MEELTATTEQRINELHQGLVKTMRCGIEQAIEIGQLLTAKKAELKHGEFTPWVRENLVFTDRTARNYMRLYANREWVMSRKNLSGAYATLAGPENGNVSDLPPRPPRDGMQHLVVNVDRIASLTKTLTGKVVTVNTALREMGIETMRNDFMNMLTTVEFNELFSAVTTMLDYFGIDFKAEAHAAIQRDALPEPIQDAEVIEEVPGDGYNYVFDGGPQGNLERIDKNSVRCNDCGHEFTFDDLRETDTGVFYLVVKPGDAHVVVCGCKSSFKLTMKEKDDVPTA